MTAAEAIFASFHTLLGAAGVAIAGAALLWARKAAAAQATRLDLLQQEVTATTRARHLDRLGRTPSFQALRTTRTDRLEILIDTAGDGKLTAIDSDDVIGNRPLATGDFLPGNPPLYLLLRNRRQNVALDEWKAEALPGNDAIPMARATIASGPGGKGGMSVWALRIGHEIIRDGRLDLRITFETTAGHEDSQDYRLTLGQPGTFARTAPPSINSGEIRLVTLGREGGENS